MTSVYICTGFLDSGKTTFIKEILMKQEWIEDGPTLLFLCEEGEEQYPQHYLDENGMFVFTMEEPDQLNEKFFRNCERIYHPVQVVVEYNGTWKLEKLMEQTFPENWEIQGVYSTVNGATLDMYLKNMRNMLMGQLTESEMIAINRCKEDMDRSALRRALKIQNPKAQLIFEKEDGTIISQTEEELPFDIQTDVIEVDEVDFGTWYVDAYEHPEHYLHKEISFLAQTFRPKGMAETMMIPGRQIMTCCVDDIRFYGYPCKIKDEITFEQRGWAQVKVRFEIETLRPFAPKQPVLYLLEIEKAKKPKEEVVYV